MTRRTAVVTAVTAALLAAGCAAAPRTGAPAAATPLTSAPPPPPGAHLTSDVHDGWPGTQPVTVRTDRGRITTVALALPGGHDVPGTLAADGSSWTSTQELPPNTRFTLAARESASAAAGAATLNRSFSTGPPAAAFTVDVTPWGEQVVGIGQPIIVRTNREVTRTANRSAVEHALTVTVDGHPVDGAWHWANSTELHYREQAFWPANAHITVTVGLSSVHLAPGVWGTGDRVVSFRTGRSMVLRIDDATHQMTVTRDGTVVRTVPVSMGRTGYETRSGIKTIMSHEKTVRMTSSSYGGADYYDEIVHDAMRLTNSGEYIHSAPWSVASQGYQNVSHGCVNVSPANAAWLMTNTLIGDPVITTGTSRSMEPGNGTGADWDIPWNTWLGGSGGS